jgi:hypothetical protein
MSRNVTTRRAAMSRRKVLAIPHHNVLVVLAVIAIVEMLIAWFAGLFPGGTR